MLRFSKEDIVFGFSLFFLLFFTRWAYGLNNGLALTPPMGFMTWQRFRCVVDCETYPDDCINDVNIRAMMDHLVQDGYLAAGYEYIIIDDCWMDKVRGEDGRLRPDPIRFPDGIRILADYAHKIGLKFGIYEDYGTKTCKGYPGMMGHLETDVRMFAEWEVDYIKVDACYSDYDHLEAGYIELGRLLNQTGRPIVYSCSWPAYQEPLGIESNYSILAEHCNLWRNWDDIDDSWSNVTNILSWFSKNQDRLSPYHGPGHWNDPDMLLIGNFGLSYEQSKAQMAVWAVFAAPLLMSVDLRTIEPKFRDILLNRDAIAVNQDPLGYQGKLVHTVEKIDVWLKLMTPIVDEHHTVAIAFLSNRVDGYPYKIDVSLKDLKMGYENGYEVQDIFEPKGKYIVKPDGNFTVRVKPSGVVFLKAVPIKKEVQLEVV